MSCFALLMLVVAAPVGAAPVPKALKKQPLLCGVWVVVDRQNNGTRIDWKKQEFWVFDTDEIRFYDGIPAEVPPNDEAYREVTEKWVFPDSTDPTALDAGVGEPTFNIGRVECDGDTLRIAFALELRNGRPVAVTPSVGVAYIEFRRVDPEKLKAK